MKVIYDPDAESVIYEIEEFVDSLNTFGAGDIWVQKLMAHIRSYALPHATYALCHHTYLALLGLSCINYNDWIIAFKIEDDLFIVQKIIRGSILI